MAIYTGPASLFGVNNIRDNIKRAVFTYHTAGGVGISAIDVFLSWTKSVDDALVTRSIDLTEQPIDESFKEGWQTQYEYTITLTDEEVRKLVKGVTNGGSRTIWYILRTTIDKEEYFSTGSASFDLDEPNPTLSVTLEDINPDTVALTGSNQTYIRYASNLHYVMTATAANQATIEDYHATMGDTTLTGGPEGTFNEVEESVIEFLVRDSRNLTAHKKLNLNVIPYVRLTAALRLVKFSIEGDLTFSIRGNFYNGSFGYARNMLDIEYTLYRNGQAITSATRLDPVTQGTLKIDGKSYEYTYTISGLETQADGSYHTYAVQATVYDKVNPGITTNTISTTSIPVFDWNKEEFNFNVPVNFVKGYTQPNSALKQLWNGNYQMESSSVSITLNTPISDLPNGIVLIFTPWNSTTGLANDDKLMSFFVSKKAIQVAPSKLHTFFLLSGADFGTIGAKSLYIGHDSSSGLGKVTGYATNDDKGTKNGITFDNTQFVLRYILGV